MYLNSSSAFKRQLDQKLVFKSHRTCLAKLCAFLLAPQTSYKFSPKPGLALVQAFKSPDAVVSQRKGKTFAAPRLPKCSFYHKAHLVKLTPLQAALQTCSFK